MAEPYIMSQVQFASTSTGGAQANTVVVAGGTRTTTYVSGFEVTGAGATGASVITVTLTGGGITQNWSLAIPAGAAIGINPLIVTFEPPLAVGINQTVTLTVPTFGVGNTNASANLRGFFSQI